MTDQQVELVNVRGVIELPVLYAIRRERARREMETGERLTIIELVSECLRDRYQPNEDDLRV